MQKKRVFVVSAAVAAVFQVRSTFADSYQLIRLVDGTTATAGAALGAFGYNPGDPSNNIAPSLYIVGYGASSGQMYQVTGFDSGALTSTLKVSTTAWQYFSKGANPIPAGRANGTETLGAFLLNPQPIGDIPANSFALLIDAAPQITDGSSPSTPRPDLTQRIYTYNLGTSQGDANDVFTSRLTLQGINSVAGSTGSDNMGRQFAWSGDGQSIYFDESSGATAGIWNISALGTSAPVRVTPASETADLLTEPVITTSGSVDTIYFRGGGSTGNQGGIDDITFDRSTNTGGTRHVFVPASKINSTLEISSGSITISSMATDSDGDMYFNDTGSARPGVYRLDPQGRISKVFDSRERALVYGGTRNVNTLRMQTREVMYSGPNGSFPVQQLMYEELGSGAGSQTNVIGGAYVFKPGDFNRDNIVSAADATMFKAALTPKGISASDANLEFDMNGNNEVSYQDVKIFQSFYGFADGDANMDGVVNTLDFNALATNFGHTSDDWVQGDFTGDNTVNSMDFDVLASHFGQVNALGGASAAMATALAATAVPEPTSLLSLTAVGAMTLRRRRMAS